MARYSAHGSDTNTDNTTIFYISASATVPRRTKVYDILIGSKDTPADKAVGYEFQRLTAENTPGGTAVTPRLLDPGDVIASTNKPREAPTGEPTYTAGEIVLYIPLNQRATMRWVAAPGGELVTPAVADDGLGCVADTPAASAFASSCCMHFEE